VSEKQEVELEGSTLSSDLRSHRGHRHLHAHRTSRLEPIGAARKRTLSSGNRSIPSRTGQNDNGVDKRELSTFGVCKAFLLL
jgi:hypothetical protein